MGNVKMNVCKNQILTKKDNDRDEMPESNTDMDKMDQFVEVTL